MSAEKLVTLYGLLGNTEASYNAGGALAAASHGILLAEPVAMAIDYVHAGERGPAPGASGLLKRGKPSGRFGELTAKIEGRGRGSAYSGSNFPPDIHTLMRISGHSATVDTTLNAEKVTYRPVSDRASFASGVFEGYARGQKYPITGAYADFTFMIDGPSFLMFEFALQGLIGIPTDVAVPAISYPGAEPPKAENIGLTIGAWSPVVRKVGFKANRGRSARADVNGAGHQGFSLGRRNPELEITVEAVPLSVFDPYTARDSATSYAVTLTVGGVQYNKIQFTAAQAQIANVADEEDEDTALWTLTMPCAQSSPIANDDYELVLL